MTTITEDPATEDHGTGDHGAEVGLRERKKLQTRAAIHDAAFRLIDEQGLEATTIEQICQEAEVSTRTFFNYFTSKAAAAFEFAGSGAEPEVQAQFRAASGSLVSALCVAVASGTRVGPDHLAMKKLIIRRPELMQTISKMMVDVRGSFVALAAERASSREQAELAVSLVFTALGSVMHDDAGTDLPLADRLRSTIDRLVAVNAEQLTD